ncbi:MutS-related protein [Candidimonas nitroreducens]|uniref:DNA mismatch repair protein MutS n=1 Tax=Candidimonas nitroreducens TaxID=683354 RepID=A0A225N5P4_9BURK|nr:DNA mismatch repair protein MutS [Candidimonas nitroreducens]OWT66329.1 DNA mismatch repair protein MutS [Candidimonas nitroreducens]
MDFNSILFQQADAGLRLQALPVPDFFTDLSLDKIVATVIAGKEAYDLAPFFRAPLDDLAAIRYRNEIMRDLDGGVLIDHVRTFAQAMRDMRERLLQAEKLYYKYQKQWWFLDAVRAYCDGVTAFARDVEAAQPQSAGMSAWRNYLASYVQGPVFRSLQQQTAALMIDLAAVRYCMHIHGDTIEVLPYAEEPDYSAIVEQTFEKFKLGAVKDYRVKFPAWPDMNHVEAQVLDLVAQRNPEVFARLDAYCESNKGYLDAVVARFDREVQFYVAWLEHLARLRGAGLKFCYAEMSDTDKSLRSDEGFDMALAYKLVQDGTPVVCNDFHLEGMERIFIVSGPNNGGKTTFSRTFGQLHYLASLGCMVAGSRARLFLPDRIYTHYEREENIKNLRGKLQDDLVRIHGILQKATPRSIVIMNEIFTSTTTQDALALSRSVLEHLIEQDIIAVCVTFLDELGALSDTIVSMSSTIVPDNPAQRTYKVVRKQPDGLAYALSIAEKYRLTYALLKERLPS